MSESKLARFVHRSDHPDGPFMIVGEVAEYFERHPDTIRRWGKVLGLPNHEMELGEKGYRVWCYTKSDIEALEEYSKTVNPKGGRPKNKVEDEA